jgi:hypothetical protein
MKTLFLTGYMSLAASSALAQTVDPDVRGGVLVGRFMRTGEDIFTGTNGALGSWIEIMQDRWALEVDVSRSRLLQTREDGCIRASCDVNGPANQFAPATRRERNWTVAVEALRRFRTADRDEPYVLFGAGIITRDNALVFDDLTIPPSKFRRLGVAPVGGAGIDCFVGRVVIRLQYRYQTLVFGFPGGIAALQQLRAGIGWDF